MAEFAWVYGYIYQDGVGLSANGNLPEYCVQRIENTFVDMCKAVAELRKKKWGRHRDADGGSL